MHQQIFITLPAKDLVRTKAFWQALGYGLDPKFSGDNAVSVILGEHIRLMLANEETFMHFSHKAVCDTSQALEVLHALSFDSREHVDALIAKARQHLAVPGRVGARHEQPASGHERALERHALRKQRCVE